MNFKVGMIFSLLVIGVMMLLIPSASLSSYAQEYEYENEKTDDFYDLKDKPYIELEHEYDEKYYQDSDQYYYEKHHIPSNDESVFCNNNDYVNNYDKNKKCLIECPDSGFIVTNEINCPQKCPDGTYLMKGMNCPAVLTIIKNFNGCIIDNDGSSIECPPGIPSSPEDFIINIEGVNVNPSSFTGSDSGTSITLNEGDYEITEKQIIPLIPSVITIQTISNVPSECNEILGKTFDSGSDLGNGLFLCTSFSNDCSGNIKAGESRTCIINTTVAVDSFIDLAVTNSATSDISILLGNGDGTFGSSTQFPLGFNGFLAPVPESLAVFPINQDNNKDIVTANFNSNQISVLLGNGDGTFGSSKEFDVEGVSPEPISVVFGYFDSDLNIDVVTANFNFNTISVFLGNGDGTFRTSAQLQFQVGGNNPGPNSIAVGFFNSDTNYDVVTTNFNSGQISVFLGNGDGTFRTSTQYTIGGSDPSPASIALGYFNSDANVDIVTANGGSDQISVFLGNGDGTFNQSIQYNVGSGTTFTNPRSVAVGYFNTDDNMDVVTANLNANSISVFLGNGDGTFESSNQFPIEGINPISISVNNFNADSNYDIVTANFISNNVSVLLGNGDGTFESSTQFSVGDGGSDPKPTFIETANLN